MIRNDRGHDHTTNMFVVFLAGSAIGAATALLLAPQSGRRTRRLLRRKAEESLDQLADTGREVYDRCQELAGDAERFVKRQKQSLAG
jgi:gas vesicle protein